MNYRFIIILLLIVSPARMLRAQEIVPTDCPNQTQLEMQKRGYGMFIHFGVNTFDEKDRIYWTVTNEYVWHGMQAFGMSFWLPSIMMVSVCGIAVIQRMMLLLHR